MSLRQFFTVLPIVVLALLLINIYIADQHPPTGTETNGQVAFQFSDDFERNDAPTLGPEWTNCNEVTAGNFEPLGILDGAVVVSDPTSRPGVYDQVPPSDHPPTYGRLHPGIGCAWIDTGSTSASVTVTWSGNYGTSKEPPVSHVEASPLMYINPDHPRYAFGAWTSELFERPVVLIGYIGSPPEDFEAIAAGFYGEHVSGSPREVEIRAESPGKVTVWIDGEQVSFHSGFGLDPIEVDPELTDSTLHGIAADAHYVSPTTAIPTIKAIESVVIKSIERDGGL